VTCHLVAQDAADEAHVLCTVLDSVAPMVVDTGSDNGTHELIEADVNHCPTGLSR
jgi:hypothetical protein